MTKVVKTSLKSMALSVVALAAFSAQAESSTCKNLPSYENVKAALVQARTQNNGGFNLDMWATLVDRSGVVCAVVYTGANTGDQWLGSRVISAQKANTAVAFSLPGLALSTANLYAAVQPGGSLFGLQESNPVRADIAYSGDFKNFGTKKDPILSKRVGGINVFGGGLALYSQKGELVGGIGVSGDSSCADHNIAWRLRSSLNLDYVPAGVSAAKDDNIIYDIGKDGKSAGGFGHAACGGKEAELLSQLPKVRKK